MLKLKLKVKSDMKKILILTNYLYGTLRFQTELIQKLGSKYEVVICGPKSEYQTELNKLGVKRYYELPINRRGKNIFEDLFLIFNYIKLIRNVRPNLVLSYSIKPNIYGSIAARILKVNYINSINGLGSTFIKKNILQKMIIFLYKIALKKSECVFFQNEYGIKLFKENRILNSKHLLTPGSGVNTDKFPYVEYHEEDKIIVNFIGRIMHDKGVNEFISLAKYITDKYPNKYEFRLIGKIENTENEFISIFKDLEKNAGIKYLGFRLDIYDLIRQSNYLVHPSYSEGMSNVVLESAATGRIILASNIPGCKEAVENGKTGFLFEPHNYKDLIEKFETALKLTIEEKKEMAYLASQKMKENFDKDIVTNIFITEIRTILNE